MGRLRYFLGIEVAWCKEGINLSQRKYALEILEEMELMGAKPVKTPMDPSVTLCLDQGKLLSSLASYRRLVGKLNYLTIKYLDISFAVGAMSQYVCPSFDSHAGSLENCQISQDPFWS